MEANKAHLRELFMGSRRKVVLVGFGFAVAVILVGGWVAGSLIESPADVAARAAAPTPSHILVPIEKRVLSSQIVTRGTARFGLPKTISVAPSVLKPDAGLITTLPLPNTQVAEGDVLLTASGRPLLVLAGQTPAYRDLVPGISGEDVRQLEQGLERLGFDPGPVDGAYDEQTSAAVARWYEAGGWEPFGPTRDQIAAVRLLERDFEDATKNKLAAGSAAAAAGLSVEAARANAQHNKTVAEGELAARMADKARLIAADPDKGAPLVVESQRARARYARTSAEAELAAAAANRALVVLDPRQTATAREAAEARLAAARAAARNTELEGELGVQAAEREAKLIAVQLEQAEAAVKSAGLAGDLAVRAAIDAQKVAELEARLASERASRASEDLRRARRKLGIQVPVDEIVFVPELPVRVQEVTAVVGDVARGPVMSVTDNRVTIDAALPLNSGPLVRPGMPVAIDEQAMGIKATGVVETVADTPGTRGVDGYHFYMGVRVDPTPMPLQGFSMRLTIPIKSTDGEVTVVPISALSLSSDGTSRVQVNKGGRLVYVVVEPGLSADGFVEVIPVEGSLEPGEMVVVGYEAPRA